MYISCKREKSVEKKLERFYKDISENREKDQSTRSHTDRKFNENKIKDITINTFTKRGKTNAA